VKIHPSDLILEDLLVSPGDARRRLLRHLAGCTLCRSRLHSLPRRPTANANGLAGAGPAPAAVSEKVGERLVAGAAAGTVWPAKPGQAGELVQGVATLDYGPAIERSDREYRDRADAMAIERREAPALVDELFEHKAERRGLLLRNSSRFHTWAVYELLIERSWQVCISDPEQGEEQARLALELSEHLDSSRYRLALIEDLRARAWSFIGNSRRLRANLGGAEQAFETAYEHLKRGTRESIERAMFLDLKASLRRAQRRFDEAFKLLRRAVDIFLEQGDQHRAGRSLVNLSVAHSVAGRPDEGIPLLHQALDLIDPDQEPRLLISAWHNLIFTLADLGRCMEAQGLYRKAQHLYRKFPDRAVQNRRKWVKAKIARGLGQHDTAEALFLEARGGFIAEGIPYETAVVSLELATLYAEQGRTAELKRLAEEIVPFFASRHIHREAIAALVFLKQAVEAEQVSLEIVSEVAAFLKRAQDDPGLRFERTPAATPPSES
jgi:tetratricopeptide (TPR) repeat protein